MLLISCIWYLALLCHLLSLDILCVNATCLMSNYHICELCNAILLQDIIYVNYAMSCCLAKRHICELYHDVLFLYFSLNLSTMFVYSTALPVHQPFESIMGKSGVKTRSSEQSVLPVDEDFLLVTNSSSEEDQRQMTSPIPPRCML